MQTPDHLKSIGLLESSDSTYEKDINYLFKSALEKVCKIWQNTYIRTYTVKMINDNDNDNSISIPLFHFMQCHNSWRFCRLHTLLTNIGGHCLMVRLEKTK